MAIVKVAMLSMTFQNWSRLYFLFEIVPLDSNIYDRHYVLISTAAPRRTKH